MKFGKIHHLGIVVVSIKESLKFYVDFLGYDINSQIVEDETLNVRVVLLKPHIQITNPTKIELVEELKTPSPISNLLKANNRLYHYCIEVKDIELSLKKAREYKCIPVVKPTPAKLFDGRSVAFVFTPDRYLIEFLEE